MSTPHNAAGIGDIAKTVLMPGDPLRAKFIASEYLEHPVLFNTVRNMFGYTGYFKGHRVSIMGSGMGMPSIGIYSYELYHFYEVENIIRIGSAGAYTDALNLYDMVLVDRAWSETSYALAQANVKQPYQYPNAKLNEAIKQAANDLDIPFVNACIHSSDVFYREQEAETYQHILLEHNCVCVEMESYALFHNANILNKKAACLLTISDSLVTNEGTSSQERETSFHNMVITALTAAASLTPLG